MFIREGSSGRLKSHLRTELVGDALQMAVWRRRSVPGLVHNPNQGVQYSALSFSERLREMGITPSMERSDSALDNTMAESFISTLKAELESNMEFPIRQAAKTAIFDYLETFYNTSCPRSSLGCMSPSDFEEDGIEEARVAQGQYVHSSGASPLRVCADARSHIQSSS